MHFAVVDGGACEAVVDKASVFVSMNGIVANIRQNTVMQTDINRMR